jgi:hypothetical protein
VITSIWLQLLRDTWQPIDTSGKTKKEENFEILSNEKQLFEPNLAFLN